MSGALRILLVEDSPTDAKLVLNSVQRAGYQVESERVENQEAMLAALHRQAWDLILCDWALPRFSAMGALETLKMKRLDIPFIIVSGTIGEEAAADAMRSGAQDCVLKDRLARLVPAIERELREAKERAARRASEEALRVSEARFRALWNSGFVLINIGDLKGRIQEINDAGLQMLGYTRQELIGKLSWDDLTAPESRPADEQARADLNQGTTAAWEKVLLHKSGRRIPVLAGAAALDGEMGIGIAIDLTSRKEAEARVRASEARFARLAKSGIIGILVTDINGVIYEANRAYLDMLGYSREELLHQATWTSLTPPEWRAADEAVLERLRSTGAAAPWEKELWRKDGTRAPVLIGVAMLEPPQCISFVADLTERKRAEAALQKSENQLRHAQKMEAVGRLAAGVAHDFNNILSVVLSYCATLLEDLREGDPLRDDVSEIQKAAGAPRRSPSSCSCSAARRSPSRGCSICASCSSTWTRCSSASSARTSICSSSATPSSDGSAPIPTTSSR